MNPTTIFLIGFPGVGKTFWGQKLALALNYSFVDSDQEIEKIEQLSIAELFDKKGESYFRLKEKVWIDKLSVDKSVISVGGGLPCFNDMIHTLKQKGRVIYLKASPEYLYKKITEDIKNSRPLLKNEAILQQKIERLLSERSVYYEQAHRILDVESSSFWNILLDFVKDVRE